MVCKEHELQKGESKWSAEQAVDAQLRQLKEKRYLNNCVASRRLQQKYVIVILSLSLSLSLSCSMGSMPVGVQDIFHEMGPFLPVHRQSAQSADVLVAPVR